MNADFWIDGDMTRSSMKSNLAFMALCQEDGEIMVSTVKNMLVQSCDHVYSSEERDARVEPTTLRPESRGTTRLDPRTILDCYRMHTTPRQTSTIGYWSTPDTDGVVRAMLSMPGKAGVMGALLTYSYSHLKRRLHRTD
jgi:hypothetical protein